MIRMALMELINPIAARTGESRETLLRGITKQAGTQTDIDTLVLDDEVVSAAVIFDSLGFRVLAPTNFPLVVTCYEMEPPRLRKVDWPEWPGVDLRATPPTLPKGR